MSDHQKEPPEAKPPEFPEIPTPLKAATPTIDGLKAEPTTHFPKANQAVPPDPDGPKPARLDQDAGGGFNRNNTYPQT